MSGRATIRALGGVLFLAAALSGASCGTGTGQERRTTADAEAAEAMIFDSPTMEVRDVRLGPGDEITITVFRNSDLDRRLEIPNTGVIYMPLIGDLEVAGKSPGELRREITEKLDRFVVDPHVNVEVAVRRSQRVIVLGEVRNPGVFSLDRKVSAIEAIGLAGGFLLSGSQSCVYHHRLVDGKPVQRILNLKDLQRHGNFSQNPQVIAGDIIYVPPTTFAEMDRFARHISIWMTPILQTQNAIVLGDEIHDRFSGDQGGDTNLIIIPNTTP